MKFYQTTIIKKFFLCSLLLNSINFFAMKSDSITKQINQQAKVIHAEIDKKILGIDSDSYFKATIESLKSYYHTSYLSDEQIIEKMQKVENCITENIKTTNLTNDMTYMILEKLSNTHLYVGYLVQAYIQKYIKNFANVTCSTLDQLLYPKFANDPYGTKKMFHQKASTLFAETFNLNDKLWKITYQTFGNIHYTVLYGHKVDIDPNSMTISKNNKYLKTTDKNHITITWNIKEGKQIKLQQEIEWQSNNDLKYTPDCIIDTTNTYAACCINGRGFSFEKFTAAKPTDIGIISIPIIFEKNESVIVLFKRPTLASYLCQELFDNNKNDKLQLAILRNTQSFKSIEGFPRKRLEQNNEII